MPINAVGRNRLEVADPLIRFAPPRHSAPSRTLGRPKSDQVTRNVAPVLIAPADLPAVRALLGEIAHDHLPLDQVDHKRFSCLVTRPAGLAVVRHLRRGYTLEPDMDAAGH